MRAFWTLVWLQLQNSTVLLLLLLGLIGIGAVSTLFTAIGSPYSSSRDLSAQILSFLFIAGAGIVMAWIVLECVLLTKDGHRQFLHCSPSSSYVHVLAPFAFFASVLLAFWLGMFLVGEAILWLTVRADLRLADVGFILYALVAGLFPAVAWVLLLREFISAFAPGWSRVAAAFTYLAGSAALVSGLVWGVRTVIFRLPGWFGNAGFALPQEPFWVGLIATALLLLVAGKIRWEVEL